jgi:hypothetical protein
MPISFVAVQHIREVKFTKQEFKIITQFHCMHISPYALKLIASPNCITMIANVYLRCLSSSYKLIQT